MFGGILLVVVGAIWVLQGAGFLKGSFMTGQGMWLFIGLGCVAVGAWLIIRSRRSLPGG